MSTSSDIELRRVYGDRDRGKAGRRVLVDRLWPRGVAKADAGLDEWLKDVAPSTELRRWYGHDVQRFDEFARRYRAELRRPPASDAVRRLIELARAEKITLLTATRDVEHSGARVLHQQLTSRGIAVTPPEAARCCSPDDPLGRGGVCRDTGCEQATMTVSHPTVGDVSLREETHDKFAVEETTMTVRVDSNGFGRIGGSAARVLLDCEPLAGVELVAASDPNADSDTLALVLEQTPC